MARRWGSATALNTSEFVAARGTDDIHVIDRLGQFTFGRYLNNAFESMAVMCGDFAPVRIKGIEVLKHDPPNGGIDLVEPNVIARKLMVVLALAPMVPQHSQPLSHLGVVRRDASAVAKHRQVLRREKTEGPEISDAPNRSVLVFGALSLRTIFNDPQMMPGGDSQHTVNVQGMAVKIDWNYADRAWSDRGFDLVEVHQISLIHVHEYWPRSQMDQRLHRRECRVTRDDNFIARPHALKLVQKINDQRPGRAQHAMFDARVRRQLGLKGLRLFAENILAGTKRPQRSLLHFGIYEAF